MPQDYHGVRYHVYMCHDTACCSVLCHSKPSRGQAPFPILGAEAQVFHRGKVATASPAVTANMIGVDWAILVHICATQGRLLMLLVIVTRRCMVL